MDNVDLTFEPGGLEAIPQAIRKKTVHGVAVGEECNRHHV